MTIETKYNIGDEVWYIIGEKAKQGKVLGITITETSEKITGYYYVVSNGPSHCSFIEQSLYPTKEELLNSL